MISRRVWGRCVSSPHVLRRALTTSPGSEPDPQLNRWSDRDLAPLLHNKPRNQVKANPVVRAIQSMKHYTDQALKIWNNRKNASDIRNSWESSDPNAVTRCHADLVFKTYADMHRFLGFGTVFCMPVIGYTTPLIADYVPRLVPTSFRTIKQCANLRDSFVRRSESSPISHRTLHALNESLGPQASSLFEKIGGAVGDGIDGTSVDIDGIDDVVSTLADHHGLNQILPALTRLYDASWLQTLSPFNGSYTWLRYRLAGDWRRLLTDGRSVAQKYRCVRHLQRTAADDWLLVHDALAGVASSSSGENLSSHGSHQGLDCRDKESSSYRTVQEMYGETSGDTPSYLTKVFQDMITSLAPKPYVGVLANAMNYGYLTDPSMGQTARLAPTHNNQDDQEEDNQWKGWGILQPKPAFTPPKETPIMKGTLRAATHEEVYDTLNVSGHEQAQKAIRSLLSNADESKSGEVVSIAPDDVASSRGMEALWNVVSHLSIESLRRFCLDRGMTYASGWSREQCQLGLLLWLRDVPCRVQGSGGTSSNHDRRPGSTDQQKRMRTACLASLMVADAPFYPASYRLALTDPVCVCDTDSTERFLLGHSYLARVIAGLHLNELIESL